MRPGVLDRARALAASAKRAMLGQLMLLTLVIDSLVTPFTVLPSANLVEVGIHIDVLAHAVLICEAHAEYTHSANGETTGRPPAGRRRPPPPSATPPPPPPPRIPRAHPGAASINPARRARPSRAPPVRPS